MRNILALVGFLVVGFAVAGYFLGWYQLTSEPSPDGHRKFNVDLNTKKIGEDVQTGTQKVGEVINNQTKGSTTPTASDQNPQTPPKKDGEVQTTGFQFTPEGTWIRVQPKTEFKTYDPMPK
ncbi:MAG: hypothetical protein FJ303_12520 [Planctomycetes bacterium]|nr:hypothetical protein [Planctomycetota bacterium]